MQVSARVGCLDKFIRPCCALEKLFAEILKKKAEQLSKNMQIKFVVIRDFPR